MATIKGFIKDYNDNPLLPITRAELVLDKNGMPAFHSSEFIAKLPDESTNSDGLPGLITAAEKALIHTLNGNSESGTIAEIYSQLNKLFEIGIKVNDTTTLSFYNADKQATPISFSNSENIVVTNADNKITLNLASKGYGKTVKSIVNKIEVDEFGRVTNVEGSNTLNNIIINNGTVSESITSDSGDLAIANKSYVDSKFNTANSVASGALKFDGVISDSTKLDEIWNSISTKVNYYYKIGFEGVISADKFHDGEEKSVKLGDTLIVYQNNGTKFVHIPSGDEPITSITVKDSSIDKISNAVGQVAFTFDAPFGVSKESNSEVKISLPTLLENNTVGVGLLSRDDYNKFQTYSAKSIQYVPNTDIKVDSADTYEIGQINFGEGGIPIHGKNTTYELGVIDGYETGEDLAKNPKLVLKPNSGNPFAIQFVGGSDGIRIENDNNTVKVTPNITSNNQTFIKVGSGYIIEPQFGGINEDKTIKNGLIDYQTTVNYVAEVHQTAAHFTKITNSLIGTENDTNPYCYGGPNLISIISVEI